MRRWLSGGEWQTELRGPGLRAVVFDSLLALGVVAALSLAIGAVERVSHVSNISNLYIIGAAVLAARRGIYAAILASILAFLVYNWFFIPPLYTFTVSDPSEYIALVTLLMTSILIGELLARVRHRATEARRQQQQTELLYEISQAALSSSEVTRIYTLALRRLSETLGLGWSRLLTRHGSLFCEDATFGALPENPDTDHLLQRLAEGARPLAVWRQPESNLRIVNELDIGGGPPQSPEGDILDEVYVPLSIESQVEGVLVVSAKANSGALSADEARFIQTFSNQLANAIQRNRLADERARARGLEESDRLKSALVSSVSHELKTPLTAIKASATSLLQDQIDDDPAIRRELVESISRETDRLTRLVSNLLDMSRLEAGALTPRLEWVSIGDVAADVLDRMEPMLRGRVVTVEISDGLPDCSLDFVLISQVLTNLLDNAVRYGPATAEITISAEVIRDEVRVTVFNEGSRIPPAELDRLFEKFYRLSALPGGTGLGLAVARGIVEAHRGRIWAENVARRGVAFTFTLPAPREEADAVQPVGSIGQAR